MVGAIEIESVSTRIGCYSPHFTIWGDGTVTLFGRNCQRVGDLWMISPEDSLELMEEISPHPYWETLVEMVQSAYANSEKILYVLLQKEAARWLFFEGYLTPNQLLASPREDSLCLAVQMIICGMRIEVDFCTCATEDEVGVYIEKVDPS